MFSGTNWLPPQCIFIYNNIDISKICYIYIIYIITTLILPHLKFMGDGGILNKPFWAT